MTIKPNILHHYVDLLRISDGEERTPEQSETCVTALHNVIRTMRLSRHDKICGEDFSRLDFGNIPFNGVYYSLNGESPSCFDGCRLNEWNFMSGHSGAVKSAAWSSDGKQILTVSDDGTAIIWDAEFGLMRNKIIWDGKTDFSGYYTDNENEQIHIFNFDSIKKSDLENEDILPFIKEDREYINSVAYSNDGKYCVTGSLDKTVKIWDLKSGKCLHILSGHSKSVSSTSFSPDGKYCLTGSWDRTAKIWDCTTGKCLKTLSGQSFVTNVVVRSRDGKYCITSSADGSLKMWDLQDQKCIWVLENYALSINETLPEDITKLNAKSVSPLDVIAHQETSRILPRLNLNVKRVDIIMTLLHIMQYAVSFCPAAFSPDGKYCLIGLDNGNVHLLRVETGECLSTIEINGEVASLVAFSPNSKHFLIVSADNTVEIWHIEKEECLKVLKVHNDEVTSVAFLPDGKCCLTGSESGEVKLWNIESGKLLKELKVDNESIDSLSFSPDGNLFLTSSKSGTAKMWKYKTGECLKTIRLVDTNGIVKWDFPYATVTKDNISTIYRFDCFNPNGRDEPEHIGSFFNIDGMHIINCPFRNITANENAQKILYQYGGITDPDSE